MKANTGIGLETAVDLVARGMLDESKHWYRSGDSCGSGSKRYVR